MPHFNDLRVTWQVPHKRYWLPAVPTALLWARNLTEQSRHHLKHYVASTTSCNKKQVVRTLNQGQMYQGCPWHQRVWTQVFSITEEVPHHQTPRHKRLGDPNFLWQRRTPVQPEMPNVGSERKQVRRGLTCRLPESGGEPVSLPPVPHLNVQITGLQHKVAALKVEDHHCPGVGFTWPQKASGKQAVATPS